MRPIRRDSLPLVRSQIMKQYTVHLFCTRGAKHTRKFAEMNLPQNRVLCPNASRILCINPVNKSQSQHQITDQYFSGYFTSMHYGNPCNFTYHI